ncbi:hypothetical protein FNAPI_9877 [Fusarium napiforme]|uniref:Uncharacterized protein n=1 Tax=Fusarium napiforme TaxID=42672 RepID=A0A8H5IVI1_9HYPO|nr:hypothetical protein FNAPI_9877 [Fusarium napiforme]
MSLFKRSDPRQSGNQPESYPDADKMDIDTDIDVLITIPSSPTLITRLLTQYSKLQHLLCLLWLSGVLIYTAISVVSSADIIKLLAWKHRDDFVLSLHFRFSRMFLQSYFRIVQWKASTNDVSAFGYGYCGSTNMGWRSFVAFGTI